MSRSLAQSVYARLPALGKDLACTMEGWRLRRLRCGGRFQHYCDEYRRSERWTAEERRTRQLEALRRMLAHCEMTVPYYREAFRRLGFSPADLKELSDLRHLPVLTKADILENAGALRSSAVERREVITLHTSGTTGTPLQVAVTRESLQAYQAAVARHRSWFGVEDGMSHATFNGRSILPVERSRPPYWVRNHSGRQTLFSLYHLRDEALPAYFAELSAAPRDYVDGYPSSVSVVARFMNENGLRLPWRPRAVFLSSETLGLEQQRSIEEAFHAPVAQFYGMAEQAACASQCPAGRFHFDSEIGCVEFVPSATSPGFGRIVCTGLTNRAMPLVRYDTQDLVALEPASCACGRGGVVVERIDGRIESFVVTPDGVRVGRLDHVYKGLRGIRESQIVQKRVDLIVVRVVRAPEFGPADAVRLREALSSRLGPRMTIEFEYVTQIGRTKSGKMRAVISELATSAMEAEPAATALERVA